MNTISKKILLTILLVISLFSFPASVSAQCAMCRVTVENNVSSGDRSLAGGLNKGIMILLSMPYVIFGVIAFLWYRESRREYQKRINTRSYV
jgi:hypothetical protein